MSRASLPLVAFALSLPGSSLPARADVPLADKDWIEVETPHFSIWSMLGEDRTRSLAEELEGFRSIVGMLTSARQDREEVPTRIFAFAGPAPAYTSNP